MRFFSTHPKLTKLIIVVLALIVVILLYNQLSIYRLKPDRLTADGKIALSYTHRDIFCTTAIIYRNNFFRSHIITFRLCENNIEKFEHDGNWVVVEDSCDREWRINLITSRTIIVDKFEKAGKVTPAPSNTPGGLQTFGCSGTFNKMGALMFFILNIEDLFNSEKNYSDI